MSKLVVFLTTTYVIVQKEARSTHIGTIILIEMMQLINEDNGVELVVIEAQDSIGSSPPEEEESLLRTNNSSSNGRSVICTYCGAATTAVVISILCPESKMWRNGTVNQGMGISLHCVVLLFLLSWSRLSHFFFRTYNTYIIIDIMLVRIR